LLWPLYVAAVTDVVSNVMRTWVIGRLEMIADIMGIRQAKPLAHVLGMRQEIEVWELEESKDAPDMDPPEDW